MNTLIATRGPLHGAEASRLQPDPQAPQRRYDRTHTTCGHPVPAHHETTWGTDGNVFCSLDCMVDHEGYPDGVTFDHNGDPVNFTERRNNGHPHLLG